MPSRSDPNWPCCKSPICTCGKAKHPPEIRKMIAECAADPVREDEELLMPRREENLPPNVVRLV